MKHLFTLKNSRIILVLLVDGLFFSLTNPNTLPSVVLIIGFLLTLLTAYVLLSIVVGGLCLYVTRLRRTRRRLTLFLTGILGVLLALQSIGQLSLRDALVIVPIAIVVYVYLTFAHDRIRSA